MADDGAILQLALPVRPEASSAARKAITALNGSLHLVSEERLRDAQLLISEVVANAVRHGERSGAPIEITVLATAEVMRVEVGNHGAGFDPAELPGPSPERSGGWGLPIVAALAHRWGVLKASTSTVWFEIDRPQRETPLDDRPAPPQ